MFVLYRIVFCVLQSLELFLEVKGVRHLALPFVVLRTSASSQRVDHMLCRVRSHIVTRHATSNIQPHESVGGVQYGTRTVVGL